MRYRLGYPYGIWYMVYGISIWYTDMIISHVDVVILGIDMGSGLMIWEMTASIR